MAKKNVLICHIMQDMIYEVGMVKTKLYAQEMQWKKRMWPIDKQSVAWKDKKGNSHMFFDVNESDGIIRFLTPDKLNYKGIDRCAECGNRISIDAKNTYDLLKRKTINAIWGLDQSHIVLLMILGIVALIALAGIFYLIGENKNLQTQLSKYLPPPTAKLLLPLMEITVYGS